MYSILIAFLILAAAILGLCSWITSRPRGRQFTPLANDGALTAGEHQGGRLTGLMDSLYTLGTLSAYPNGNRFFLVKQGVADGTYAPITSVIDQPIAVCTDDPVDTVSPVNFQSMLGADKTQRMVASGVIAAGKPVVTNGDGTVAQLGSVAGIYWCVGYAKTSTTTAGDLLEVLPALFPIPVNALT